MDITLTNDDGPESRKKRVAYFYEPEIGNYYYGQNHPMKPHRMRLTHTLVISYGMHRQLEMFRPRRASEKDLQGFHSEDYIDFLKKISPDNQLEFHEELRKFNVGEDCPVFDGLFQYCQTYAGGSVGCAAKLNRGQTDIAINWSGGLHHAKKCEASGFCYVNDIVLAILELLKVHKRVLYVDIDIHHGDGVEEAFYTTDRVMTCSFHKYGHYFPGTGDLQDVGCNAGKYYAVNVPLLDGVDDESYQRLFKPVVEKIMEVYQPEAVVLQCGADSLTGDRLGCFNLTVEGHGECVRFLRQFNVPLILVGGGGYTIRNVSRAWCYETAMALKADIPKEIPVSDYYSYYGPSHLLQISASNMVNCNTEQKMNDIKNRVLANISMLQHVPSVQMQEVPPLAELSSEDEEVGENSLGDISDEDLDSADHRFRSEIAVEGRLSRLGLSGPQVPAGSPARTPASTRSAPASRPPVSHADRPVLWQREREWPAEHLRSTPSVQQDEDSGNDSDNSSVNSEGHMRERGQGASTRGRVSRHSQGGYMRGVASASWYPEGTNGSHEPEEEREEDDDEDEEEREAEDEEDEDDDEEEEDAQNARKRQKQKSPGPDDRWKDKMRKSLR